MAIQDKGTGQDQAISAALRKQQENTGPETTSHDDRSAGREELNYDISAFKKGAAPIKRKGGATALADIIKNFGEIITEEGKEVTKFIPMENSTYNMNYSAVLIASVVDKAAAVTILVIEASGSKLAPQEAQIGNSRVEVETVVGDVSSDALWSRVIDACSGHFPDGFEIYETGTVVIPTAFPFDDHGRLHNVLFDASAGNMGLLDRKLGGVAPKYTVALWDPKEVTISARIDYRASNTETATGEIVRSDVEFRLTAVQYDEQDKAIGMNRGQDVITVGTGFLNLIYDPAEQPRNAFGASTKGNPWGKGRQEDQTQTYMAQFILTSSSNEFDFHSLEMELQTLAGLNIIHEDHNWVEGFRPNQQLKSGELDYKDIGAIAYECEFLKDVDVDTKSNDFDDVLFENLIGAAFSPDIVFSMDIPEVGPKTWVQHILLDAADGNKDAINAFFDAAENLTDGYFERNFDGDEIIGRDPQRIILGYVIDHEGQRRDIREIDYLAMLNIHGEDNMQVAIDYNDTFTDIKTPIQLRHKRQLDILRQTFGEGNVVVEGYAQRIDIPYATIYALGKGCADAGAVIETDGVYRNMSAGTRPSSNLARYAASSDQRSGLYQQRRRGSGNATRSRVGRTRW